MNDYPLTVSAEGRAQFSCGSASRVIVLDCSALVTIVVQGKKPGELRELPVQAGTWFTTSFDFLKVQVKNANTADVTLQLLVGDPGNTKDQYEHPVAKVVGSLPVPSVLTPAAPLLFDSANDVADGLNTENQRVIAENSLRKKITIYWESPAGHKLVVGEGQRVTADDSIDYSTITGIIYDAGSEIEIENSAAITLSALNSDDDNRVFYVEEF